MSAKRLDCYSCYMGYQIIWIFIIWQQLFRVGGWLSERFDEDDEEKNTLQYLTPKTSIFYHITLFSYSQLNHPQTNSPTLLISQ